MELFETKIKSRVWPSHLLFLRALMPLDNYIKRKKGMEEKMQRKNLDLMTMSRK